MSHEVLGLVLLVFMFVAILGGFPISFTLFLLGIVFGYIALGDRVFHLMTYGMFDTMNDTVLAAVAFPAAWWIVGRPRRYCRSGRLPRGRPVVLGLQAGQEARLPAQPGIPVQPEGRPRHLLSSRTPDLQHRRPLDRHHRPT